MKNEKSFMAFGDCFVPDNFWRYVLRGVLLRRTKKRLVKTAHERNWITKDDVVRIAELHNKKTFSVPGDDVAVMLKRSYAKQYPRDNLTLTTLK